MDFSLPGVHQQSGPVAGVFTLSKCIRVITDELRQDIEDAVSRMKPW